jgi:hypothetical protein
LSLAIKSWKRPIFFHGSVSQAPYLAINRGVRSNGNDNGDTSLTQRFDPSLRVLWNDLRHFARMNHSGQNQKQKLRRDTFSGIMLSILSRLLDLSARLSSLDEAFRLGMIAYVSLLFLRWESGKHDFRHLRHILGVTLESIQGEVSYNIPVQGQFWLLFMWHMLQPEEEESQPLADWLVELVGLCPSWSDARKLLDSIIWISSVNDAEGKAVYDSAKLRIVQGYTGLDEDQDV